MLENGVSPCGSLEELFSTSTVLFECEALTSKTANSVTAALLDRLPPQAVFVNIGRGLIVDEKALVERSAAGKIKVASDVYATEPVPFDAPILSLRDAVLAPHIGGPTHDLYPVCGEFALQNIRRYMNDQPLEALVTLEIYDRST
jgi:phosphoglycerate dehydrogenase-like enzyme